MQTHPSHVEDLVLISMYMALIHRMKILLGVIQELNGNLSSSRLHNLLFLYCNECVKRDEYYQFIPFEKRPYSLQAEEDKRYFITKKILESSEDWIIRPTNQRFAADLDFFEKIAIQDLKNKWSAKNDAEVTNYISENYPYYSNPYINKSDEIVFYTIGYEGISPEKYINALIENDIRMLVDVRRNPISKKYGFSKSELMMILPRLGIEYSHIPELGIESEKRQNLEIESDYIKLFREYEQTTLQNHRDKLELLQKLLAEKHRIAITCFEADPWHCHRSRIASELKSREEFNYKIKHLELCTS